MRVKIDNDGKTPYFGYMLGLIVDGNGEVQCIVRPDGFGLYLKQCHASKVTPVTEAEEALYK